MDKQSLMLLDLKGDLTKMQDGPRASLEKSISEVDPPFKLNLPLGDVDAMWALEQAIIADKTKKELLVSLMQMLMLHCCPVEYFYSGRN